MKKLLPQLELGPRIGGAKELATRVTFYNGIANTLMVAGIFYQSNPAIPGTGMNIQQIIPGMAAFYGALMLAGLGAMAFEHIVMVRAQAEYNQLQQFDENVSPIRRDIREVQDELDEIHDKLDERNDEA